MIPEMEKENFKSFFKETVENVKKNIEQISNDPNLEKQNHALIKEKYLHLIEAVHQMKKADLKFYKEILEEIPQIALFNEEVEDIQKLKNIIDECVNDINPEKNAENIAMLMKSSKIFYFINKKTMQSLSDEDLIGIGDLGLIKDYIKALWPSVKTEELASVLVYINSGKATKDYIEFIKNPSHQEKKNFLYKKFKESIKSLKVLDDENEDIVLEDKGLRHTVSSANRLDGGVVIDEERKKIFVGFATSEFQCEKQGKQFFRKIKTLKNAVKNPIGQYYGYEIESLYLTNSLLNENDLKIGEKEYKKNFLNSFSSVLTKEEKNKINCSSFLGLMGNLVVEDVLQDLRVEDFIDLNPYVAGADTLWIKKSFEKIKNLKENKKNQYLREFLIKNSHDILNILEKIPDGEMMHMSEQHAQLIKNMEKMISASLESFNTANIGNDLFNDKFIKSVKSFCIKYKEIHSKKFCRALCESVAIKGKDFYDHLLDETSVINKIEQNNKSFHDLLLAKNNIDNNKKKRLEDINNEVDKFYIEIKEIFKNSVVIFSTEIIDDCIKDILTMTQLYPARNISSLMNNEKITQNKNLKNFIQNYNNWEQNKSYNEQHHLKYNLANILLTHAHDWGRLKSELIKYDEVFNKNNSDKKVRNFLKLTMNHQRRQFANQMRKQIEENKSTFNSQYSKFIIRVRGLKIINEEVKNKLVAFLQVKAELLHQPHANKSTVNAYLECEKEIRRLNFIEDPDVKIAQQTAHKKNILQKIKSF